jgi:hypothetical protein
MGREGGREGREGGRGEPLKMIPSEQIMGLCISLSLTTSPNDAFI